VGSRIGTIPRQSHVAAKAAGRYAPRVLLTDELAPGKTIEAGLLLHPGLFAGRTSQILILAPHPILIRF
jgi:hypothetical protein